ncbi:MAG TPA: DUF1566 domain-containing protein [Polyangiaceae bacterium]|nr:DUF1566 domain-containing protein [Polyangiaceae bacterium]
MTKRIRFSLTSKVFGVTALVACVALFNSRVSANAPVGRYVIGTGATAGTVYDSVTALTWMRAPIENPIDWVGATTYCSDLTFGGSSDWRMPTVKEAATLVDESRYYPAVDSDAFPAMPSGYFWTGTLIPWDSTHAQTLHTGSGTIGVAYPLLDGTNKAVLRAICVH